MCMKEMVSWVVLASPVSDGPLEDDSRVASRIQVVCGHPV